MSSQTNNSEALRFKRAAFYNGLKSKVGLAAAKASVCLLLQDLLQSCSPGGVEEWRTCAMRDDEPRPVWMSLLITH